MTRTPQPILERAPSRLRAAHIPEQAIGTTLFMPPIRAEARHVHCAASLRARLQHGRHRQGCGFLVTRAVQTHIADTLLQDGPSTASLCQEGPRHRSIYRPYHAGCWLDSGACRTCTCRAAITPVPDLSELTSRCTDSLIFAGPVGARAMLQLPHSSHKPVLDQRFIARALSVARKLASRTNGRGLGALKLRFPLILRAVRSLRRATWSPRFTHA
jgi:hypothetical protein